jgi:hypothetical protein
MSTEYPKPIIIVLKNGLSDVNVLLSGLGELPAKMAYTLIREIETQYQTQTQESPPVAGGVPAVPPAV